MTSAEYVEPIHVTNSNACRELMSCYTCHDKWFGLWNVNMDTSSNMCNTIYGHTHIYITNSYTSRTHMSRIHDVYPLHIHVKQSMATQLRAWEYGGSLEATRQSCYHIRPTLKMHPRNTIQTTAVWVDSRSNFQCALAAVHHIVKEVNWLGMCNLAENWNCEIFWLTRHSDIVTYQQYGRMLCDPFSGPAAIW